MSISIPERLSEFIREEAGRSGYEIVDISTKSGKSFVMEVVLDKEGGILLDECTSFNRKVSFWIEEEKLFEAGYTLDVCSPGLDRELKTESEFFWAVGKEVEVMIHQPAGGKSAVFGKLVKRDDDEGVVLEDAGGNKVCIEKDNVAKAKLKICI